MKRLQKLLLLTVVALALTGAGLFNWFDNLAARHRDQVRQELQKVLGQDTTFTSLEINLIGQPGFVAKDLRIADDSRFAATPLLRAREFVLGVSLWDLLFRRLVVTSFTFNDPEVQIITDESGDLNLTALVNRKVELRKFPRLRATPSDRKTTPVTFAVDEIRIERGRIDYLDRSVREPAELRIRNISLRVQGFAPEQTTRVRVAAALTEGLGQDIRIEGQLSPPPEHRSWLQRGVDLTLRFDSLHVPVVARAIAALRDKIPSELDVTGPMALQAKARGTLEQPRFNEVTLKVPLLGSSDYNAVITGGVRFTEERTWEDAELHGRLVVDTLSLARLRKLKFLARNLPPGFVTDGAVNIYSRFEGTWQTLRIGALVRADKAELDFGSWFRKRAEWPATIRTQISRRKHRLLFHESELDLGANRLAFSGEVGFDRFPRLLLKLRTQDASVPAWSKYVAPPVLAGATGRFDLNVTVAKSLVPSDGDWSMAGRLKLEEAGFKPNLGKRKLEDLYSEVTFSGKGARFHDTRFRLGFSNFFLDGTVANLLDPRLAYSVRAPELNLADLILVGPRTSARLQEMNGIGEMHFDAGRWQVTGSVASTLGAINFFPYRDLRADIELSADGLRFKNVWARALNGLFRADGFWRSAASESGPQLRLAARFDGADLPALIGHLLPPLKDRFDGQVIGQGTFRITGGRDTVKDALEGSIETSILSGVIKDFNLVSQLLLRGSGTTVSSASISRLPPSFAGLVSRRDTPFESMNANFVIDQKRVSTENLVLTTADYTITGAGWIGFDRTTSWNGSILLSPSLTQEVQRDYRMLRYLLDRRRLSIPFRVDGKIPNVAIRLENRALAQALRGGTESTTGSDGGSGAAGKQGKPWLPDALERFLNR